MKKINYEDLDLDLNSFIYESCKEIIDFIMDDCEGKPDNGGIAVILGKLAELGNTDLDADVSKAIEKAQNEVPV